MLYKDFVKSIEILGPYEIQPIIAIGVSGGIDSLALAFLANEWIRTINGTIIALTVNHNLRIEATEEAKAVGIILQANGIEHRVLDWQHDKITSNIQELAREARIRLLTQWCQQKNVLHLMMAHHAQDQAETVLMQMCRGSGVNGLSGMSAVNIVNKVRVLRPLLNVPKSQLKRALLKYSDSWIEDLSNSNPKFMRSVARQALKSKSLLQLVNVKQNKQEMLIMRFSLLSYNLGRARACIEKISAQNMAMIVKIYPQGYLLIDYNGLLKLQEEIALNILASCLTTISLHHTKRPRFHSILRIWEQLKLEQSKFFTLWGCIIKANRNKNVIEICPERQKNNNISFLPAIALAQKQFDY